MIARWNRQALELMETLACRVRLMTVQHVHRLWGNDFGAVGTISQTLDTLIRADLLVGDVRALPPIPVGEAPLFRWKPGHDEPDFELLRERIQARWNHEHVATPIVAATDQACRLFGSSGGGMPSKMHINHDLILSEVYIRYRIDEPTLAAIWYGEHAMPIAETGIKNPDAFLVNKTGEVIRVIESTGSYSVKQLVSFHDHCVAESLPYELW
ncbi:MAG: hypothetical protein KDB23_01960 [Planctomycetales bacterium]|nr:hypothetical protein [Planctomycetales bacterium]